jgi:hypothetical protein
LCGRFLFAECGRVAECAADGGAAAERRRTLADLHERGVDSTAPMLWITIWFMVILKIPLLYMCWVIWWAVKDPPEAVGSERALDELEGGDGPGWRRSSERDRRGSRRGGPHGAPSRRRSRTGPRVASA